MVDESVNVLAPWWNESTLTVKHAEAVIIRKGVLKCVLLVHVLQSHVNSYNVGRHHPQKGRSSPMKGNVKLPPREHRPRNTPKRYSI